MKTVAIIALVLAAGSRANAQELSVWHAYGAAEARGLDAALDAFVADHPGVTVEVLANAFEAYANKLTTAIPTGEGPDVFIDAHERLGTYADRGLVVPLRGIGLRERLDFDERSLAALSIGDRLYGLPLGAKCAVLYVNTDLIPSPPSSLEQIERLRLARGVFPLVFESENAYYVAALLHAFGGRLIDPASGGFALDGPAAERTIEELVRLTDRGVIPQEPNGDLVRQLFANGGAATAISGPWLAPDLPPELHWTVVPLPTVHGEPMLPFVTIEGAFVGKERPNVALASELVRFLSGPEGSAIRARVGGQIPSSRSYWAESAPADPRTRVFYDAANRGVVMPLHPNMRLVFEPSEKALKRMLRARVEPEIALGQARRRFEDDIRPEPDERDPTIAFVAIGLILLLATALGVRRGRNAEFRSQLTASVPAYRWLVHAFVVLGVLVFAPIFVGTITSFFAGRGEDLHYVGLANYVDIVTAKGGDLFGTDSFWLVLCVTVLWTVANIALHLVLGVSLAMLLSRKKLFAKPIYRVLLILPWAVPNYVTALSWKGMFHRQFGAVNAIVEALGGESTSWFASWTTAFSANLVTNVWLGFPFMMVVTLGALAAIPQDLYEAAEVDGATRWQRFRHITFPHLKPMLAPAVAMGAVWTFNMFNVIYLVSGGEPDGTTEILVTEAYRAAFTGSARYGYAAAYSVLIFLILYFGTRATAKRLDGMGATT
jgi:arabinogalactan oligomer/maltooligosaccharide transport system permease protein